MNTERDQAYLTDSRIAAALGELQTMISSKYPSATFAVTIGEDPEGVYLTPTVDVPDTTEVFDIVIDRLLHYQIDEELPVYVVPVRPLERVLEDMRAQRKLRSAVGHGRLESLGLPR